MKLQSRTRGRVVAALRHASAELRRARERGARELVDYWRGSMRWTAESVRRVARGDYCNPACAWCGRSRTHGEVSDITCPESNRSVCYANYCTVAGGGRRAMPRKWQAQSRPTPLYVGLCVNCGTARVGEAGFCHRCEHSAKGWQRCGSCGFVAVNPAKIPAVCCHCGRLEFGDPPRENPVVRSAPRPPRPRSSGRIVNRSTPNVSTIRYAFTADELEFRAATAPVVLPGQVPPPDPSALPPPPQPTTWEALERQARQAAHQTIRAANLDSYLRGLGRSGPTGWEEPPRPDEIR